LKRAILLQNGITVGENDALRPKPTVRDCPRCNLVNTFENKYCSKCSYPLVPDAFEEIKQAENSKIQNMMQEHLQELKVTTHEKNQEIRSLKDDMNSMRDDMNNIFEILKIAKLKNGKIGKNKTMLDEKRQISFCQDYEGGRTIRVKIPIDTVELAENTVEHDLPQDVPN
jgi:hypothetical protein